MKISSVSKKVLASALSAAMVVAFAPAAAFGLTADGKVTVNFSAGEGTGVLDSYTYTAKDGKITLTDSGANLTGTFSNGDYSFAGFYYDANGNGAKDDKDITIAKADLSAPAAFEDVENGSTINLVAYYNAPAAGLGVSVSQAKPAAGAEAFTVAALSNLIKSHTYGYTIAKDGAVVYTSNDISNAEEVSKATIYYTATASEAVQGSGKVADSVWGAGVYTLTLTDKTTGKTWTDEQTVLAITLDAGASGYFSKDVNTGALTTTKVVNVLKGAESDLTGETLESKNPALLGWAKADGTKITDTEKFTEATTLTAVYDVARIDKAELGSDGNITFTAEKLATNADNKYKVEIAGPGVNASYEVATATADQAFKLTFGGTMVGYNGADYITNAKLASGEYTITVTPQYKADTKVDKADQGSAISGKVTIVGVTYDANGGKIGEDATKTVFAQTGTKTFADTVAGITAGLEGQTFQYWSTDGTEAGKVKDSDKVTADVTLKAVYKVTEAAAPTATVAAATAEGYYTISASTTTAGGVIKYSTDGTNWYTLQSTGLTTNADTVTLYTTANDLTDSVKVILQSEATAAASTAFSTLFDTIVPTDAQDPTAPLIIGSKTDHQKYSYVYKSVKEDAVKAIKAMGYATTDDWNKAVNAQALAAVKTIAAATDTYLDTLAKGIENADGTLVMGDAGSIATAKTAVATVVTKAEAAVETADKEKAVLTVTNDFKVTKLADAVNGVSTTTYAADDVAAAKAVTEALQAAKTGEEAAAAIEAYGKLTETQQKLVAAADVVAAQNVKAAAEAEATQKALVDAQDEGTLNKLSSTKKKTVKLAKGVKKTKKAQSVAYTTKFSKSGNVVTYAKKSGSSRITVKAAGTVTLKKATKKGTYTAKVKATCGTQTRTVTVKFVVK